MGGRACAVGWCIVSASVRAEADPLLTPAGNDTRDHLAERRDLDARKARIIDLFEAGLIDHEDRARRVTADHERIAKLDRRGLTFATARCESRTFGIGARQRALLPCRSSGCGDRTEGQFARKPGREPAEDRRGLTMLGIDARRPAGDRTRPKSRPGHAAGRRRLIPVPRSWRAPTRAEGVPARFRTARHPSDRRDTPVTWQTRRAQRVGLSPTAC